MDEVKNENQSLKVHVKCLKEKLSESNDKLKKVSCTKLDVKPNCVLNVPSNSKSKSFYIPRFKRNHQEVIKTIWLDLTKSKTLW